MRASSPRPPLLPRMRRGSADESPRSSPPVPLKRANQRPRAQSEPPTPSGGARPGVAPSQNPPRQVGGRVPASRTSRIIPQFHRTRATPPLRRYIASSPCPRIPASLCPFVPLSLLQGFPNKPIAPPFTMRRPGFPHPRVSVSPCPRVSSPRGWRRAATPAGPPARSPVILRLPRDGSARTTAARGASPRRHPARRSRRREASCIVYLIRTPAGSAGRASSA